MKHDLLMTAAAVAVSAVASAAGAAEGTKDVVFAGKFEVSGKIVQSAGVGKQGDEGFVLLYEEDARATGGADHTMRCLGVMQGAADRVAEQRGYCVETDRDGDQVFWKVTPAEHQAGSDAVLAVHSAIVGTGKYAGVPMAIHSSCKVTLSGPAYALRCEGSP